MKAFFLGLPGVVAGLATAVTLILIIEFAGSLVYPPPAGLDMTRPESMAAIVRAMPAGAYVFLVAGWVVGVLAGSWVATKLSAGRKFAPAIIVGMLIEVGAVANFMAIPHPIRVQVAGLVAIPIATGLGIAMARPRRKPAALLAA